MIRFAGRMTPDFTGFVTQWFKPWRRSRALFRKTNDYFCAASQRAMPAGPRVSAW